MRRSLALLSAGLLLGIASTAIADRAQTWLSAPAVLTSINFQVAPGTAVVSATICGFTLLGDAGVAAPTCYTDDLPNGAFRTSVLNLMTGNALTLWKNKEGL
jgi:hypothetical protein